MSRSKEQQALPPLSFTRRQWPELTDLPLKTLDALVVIGAFRSVMIGRRRVFRYGDIRRWLDGLVKSGKPISPRLRAMAKRRKASAV